MNDSRDLKVVLNPRYNNNNCDKQLTFIVRSGNWALFKIHMANKNYPFLLCHKQPQFHCYLSAD